MASELRAVGIDFSFAPCVDLEYGVSEIIGDRAFHRDPEAVAALAAAYLSGMREAGMAASPNIFRAMEPWLPTRTSHCRWIGATSSTWRRTCARIAC